MDKIKTPKKNIKIKITQKMCDEMNELKKKLKLGLPDDKPCEMEYLYG